MSSDESDDDENFYDMTEISSTSSKPPKINELENKTNEP
ncbi:unnamed protein product, partial [Rotaria magnacalcarata]